jgi:serine/threonine protein kinase/Flp pilus assembly protein TadD
MALAVSTRLGPYEILSILGAGGMGEVYRARDTRLEREVAIKVLPERLSQDPAALGRFQREARAVAALSHPNIVSIFDIGTEQGRNYVVMQLLEGQTLGQRLKQSALAWPQAVEIAAAIADGLAAAHAKGIIHRDIKPENIFLTLNDGVKILDFGLARLESRTPSQSEAGDVTVTVETQLGMILGTVAYMSPEQVRGQPADARSDVFSFGCMLYEIVKGLRPFTGASNADVMAGILNSVPLQLSESGQKRPAELDRLITRCLEKEPAHRFPSGRELAAALKSIRRQAALEDSADERELDTIVAKAAVTANPHRNPSVAVLPFVNMSSDKENEYFSDGLAEELINVLSKVEGLHVASRTSAFAFKGKNEDIRKIGEQLSVRTVLEGSVRKAGNKLRITAQLVNVADGYQLWSEIFNRQLEDVFAIQDEIAQSIATALKGILSEKDKRALEKAAPANVQAYDFYLRGRQFFHQWRRKSLEFAVEMFTRAIEIDPAYARAYAGLADCYSSLYTAWSSNPEYLQKAEQASQKALKLDPDLAEVHTARGLALSLNKNFDQANQEFETAIGLNPKLFEAHYFYGRTCLAQGKLAEAAELFSRASQLSPDDYQALLLGAAVFSGLGRQAEAEAAYRRGLHVAEKHLQLHPEDARAFYLGACALCQLGEKERGRDWAGRALAIDPDEPMTLYNIACVYSLSGSPEEAIDVLEKAIRQGFRHKEWIENDADLKSLREHARFKALLQTL